MKCLYANVRSIVKPGKFDELACVVSSFQNILHVVIFIETWLKSNTEAEQFQLTGYTHYYNIRPNARGGGVSIFVHNSLKHYLIEEQYLNGNHFLWVHISKFCLDIGAIYKPPSTNAKDFMDIYSSQLQKKKRSIVFGDFNFNLLCSEPSTKEYRHVISENGFKIMNKIKEEYCTRETPLTKTLLDHVCSNLQDNRFHFAIMDTPMSDHKQIYFEVQNQIHNPVKTIKYNAINYSKLFNTFKDTTSTFDTDTYEVLEKTLLACIQASKITKTRLLYSPKDDWIKPKITRDITKRNTLWNKLKKQPTDHALKNEFTTIRNQTIKTIFNTKKQYYLKSFNECSKKPLKMWKLINSLSNNKAKETGGVSKLNIDDKIVTDEQQICECFNEFFSTVGSMLAHKIPQKYHNNKTFTLTNTKHTNSKDLSILQPTNIKEVKNIIDNLNTNTSTGVDGVSTKVIKCISPVLVEDLTKCINKCIEEGSFPDTLKIAKVSAIYKAGNKIDPNNYRPISVLPVISKIFEKILYNQLETYLNEIDFLNKKQYGFRKSSNTLSATIDLVTNLKNKIDKKQISLGVFIDLKKAFDTISHDLLLEKLHSIGIKGKAHSMLKSYLTNRFQVVKMGTIQSSPRLITCGVPQGSILGPLLFIIYINNIYELDLKGEITLYADDTCLFYFGHSIDVVIEEAQKDLHLLNVWFQCNLLTINTSKTNYIIFKAKNKKIHDHKPLNIDGMIINKTNTEKYLGLLLDEHLTWKPHLEKLRSKIASLSGLLRRITGCLPRKVRYVIYNSLVKPHLDYLIEVWGSAAKTNLQYIQTTQNKIIKTLFNYDFLTPTYNLYKQTKLLNITQNYKYNTCILIFKILNNTIHSQIKFTKNSNIQKRYLRSAQDIHVPFTRTKYGKRNLTHEGAQIFNKLPKHIKECKSLQLFKKLLKLHITQQKQ